MSTAPKPALPGDFDPLVPGGEAPADDLMVSPLLNDMPESVTWGQQATLSGLVATSTDRSHVTDTVNLHELFLGAMCDAVEMMSSSDVTVQLDGAIFSRQALRRFAQHMRVTTSMAATDMHDDSVDIRNTSDRMCLEVLRRTICSEDLGVAFRSMALHRLVLLEANGDLRLSTGTHPVFGSMQLSKLLLDALDVKRHPTVRGALVAGMFSGVETPSECRLRTIVDPVLVRLASASVYRALVETDVDYAEQIVSSILGAAQPAAERSFGFCRAYLERGRRRTLPETRRLAEGHVDAYLATIPDLSSSLRRELLRKPAADCLAS